jgi:hypothetical protein
MPSVLYGVLSGLLVALAIVRSREGGLRGSLLFFAPLFLLLQGSRIWGGVSPTRFLLACVALVMLFVACVSAGRWLLEKAQRPGRG